MANKKRGEIKVNLGGRDRLMKLTLNDFAELQDRYNGQPLVDILATLDKMDVKVLRALLYFAIRQDDADLTEEQVGSFEFNLTEIATKLGECISLSLNGGQPPGKNRGK
jgi:hypothetical protein